MKGVGYFLHFHPDYIEFDKKFEDCGGISDAYEVLSLHFSNEIENLKRYVDWKDKPFSLHTAAMNLGLQGDRPNSLQMLKEQVEAIKPYSITEHHILLRGSEGNDFGVFFPPPELPEQKKTIVDGLRKIDRELDTILLVENPVYLFDLNGLQTKRRVQFFNETVKESGCRMHLSLSNIVMSGKNGGYGGTMDLDDYLAEIDMSAVDQIHININNFEQMSSSKDAKKYMDNEKWMNDSLEQIIKEKNVKPLIFFELEASTPRMVEPERLRDAMGWARDLLA